jgi:hypothetical protein
MFLKSMYALGFFLTVSAIYQLSGRLIDVKCEYYAESHTFRVEMDSERSGFFSHALMNRALRIDMAHIVYEEALWEKWVTDIERVYQLNAMRMGDRYLLEMFMTDGTHRGLGYISQTCRNNLNNWTNMHPTQAQKWKID